MAVNPRHTPLAGIDRNGGPTWTGIMARHDPELVAGMDRNTQSIEPATGWTLDGNDANHLFRVVQEAIGNVARHAGASLVEIGGRDESGDLVLSIADDGIGISAAASTSTGLGLRSMRYRAERIGAKLEIKQRRPRGTIVKIRYPMHSRYQNKA